MILGGAPAVKQVTRMERESSVTHAVKLSIPSSGQCQDGNLTPEPFDGSICGVLGRVRVPWWLVDLASATLRIKGIELGSWMDPFPLLRARGATTRGEQLRSRDWLRSLLQAGDVVVDVWGRVRY